MKTSSRKTATKIGGTSKLATTTTKAPLSATAKMERDAQEDSALQMAQLLSYYRTRAEVFEGDRSTFYSKLESTRVKQELAHKVAWEVKKRSEEKAELENALNKCQQALYLERDKILTAKTQVDTLRVKQKQNKRQILDSLAASNSVEQHVYYDRNTAPEKIQSYAPKTMGWTAEKESLQELWKSKQVEVQGGVPRVSVQKAAQKAAQPNILRTVYLPNENVGKINKENDALNGQIQEQRA